MIEQSKHFALAIICGAKRGPKDSDLTFSPAALRDFLAAVQPEQEPVAQRWTDETAKVLDHVWGTSPFRFRRFVYGQERAQDVLIEREETLERAIKKAARICPPSEMTVLVYEGVRPQASEGVAVCEYCENERPVIHAPAREPLTDDEIWEIAERSEDNRFSFARAIESAHGIGEKK